MNDLELFFLDLHTIRFSVTLILITAKFIGLMGHLDQLFICTAPSNRVYSEFNLFLPQFL